MRALHGQSHFWVALTGNNFVQIRSCSSKFLILINHFQRSTALATGFWYMTESGIPYQWVGGQLFVVFSSFPPYRPPFKVCAIKICKSPDTLHPWNKLRARTHKLFRLLVETCCEWGQTYRFQTILSVFGTRGKRGDSILCLERNAKVRRQTKRRSRNQICCGEIELVCNKVSMECTCFALAYPLLA